VGLDPLIDRSNSEKVEEFTPLDPHLSLLVSYMYLHHPMHPRRYVYDLRVPSIILANAKAASTLYQSYYYKLRSTAERDHDQVVSRWVRPYSKMDNYNILMVDQLWLWVIYSADESKSDTIISSFPMGENERHFSQTALNLRQGDRTIGKVVAHLVKTLSDVYGESSDPALTELVGCFGWVIDEMVSFHPTSCLAKVILMTRTSARNRADF
jgi:hypothetical protein